MQRCFNGPALEKENNVVAKGKATVIEFSKQKSTVAKWNLIKHKKLQNARWLNEYCGLMVNDEYSLHHKFYNVTIKEDIESVGSIKKYATSHQYQFDISVTKYVTNIATGKILENSKIEYLLNSVEQGETLNKQFLETRLVEQTKKNLLAPAIIPRNFDVENLLTYELSEQPITKEKASDGRVNWHEL